MTIIKHTIWTLLTLGAILFAACSDEEPVDFNAAMRSAPGLYVNLTISGDKAVFPTPQKTRAYTNNGEEVDTLIVGEEDLDENTVYNVDFFLFDKNGTLKTDGHVALSSTTTTGPTNDTNKDEITGDFFHSGTASLLTGSKWKDNNNQIIGVTEGDMLYALANMNWEMASATAASINSLSDLKALTYADNAIYMKRPETQAGQTTRPAKPFLMDGSLKFTQELISSLHVNEINEVTVDVKRAAAKIRINIYKSNANEWAGYNAQIGTITGSLANYASVTRAVQEGTPLEKGSRGLLSVSHNNETGKLTSYNIFGSTTKPTDYVGSMLFYTFANEWKNESSAETWLELNIPYENKDDNGTVTASRPHNYYKIVFLPNDGKQLNRNTFYEVDVMVKNDGATVSEESETITDAQWSISEWNTKNVNVIKNPTVDYLILSDYILDVRDEDNATITYYSSNPVTVEIIDLYKEVTNGKVSLADIQDTEIAEFIPRYLGRTLSSDAIAIPGVYYVNKENRRIDIRNDKKAGNKIVEVESYSSNSEAPTPTNEEVLISWPNDQAKEGPINIYSKVPQNVSKRYITLRVTMPKSNGSGNMVKYAVVEQFPLEYILIQEGLYSYADGDVLHGNDLHRKIEYIYGFPDNKKAASWYNDIYEEEITIPDSIIYGTFHDGTDLSGLGEEWTDSEKEGKIFSGRIPYSPTMKSKFFLSDKTWEDSEGIHEGVIFQADDAYKDINEVKDNDGTIGLVPNTPANNNSMYEVTITATSTKYTLSYPSIQTDELGRTYAEESEANNNLLSPHFVLASQLGNNSATAYWESAQDLCKHYVEVSRDGKFYDNWRLPTLAELQIVKSYQQSEHVYDITMNKVLNADGDTDPQYWSAGKYWYVNTTGSGGGEKQQFMQCKYENPIPDFLEADNWKMEFDWGGTPGNNTGSEGTFSVTDNTGTAMFSIKIPYYSITPTVLNSSMDTLILNNTLYIDNYDNRNNPLTIFHRFVLTGNKETNQVSLSITQENGTVILEDTIVAPFMHAANFSFELGRALSSFGLDNVLLYIDNNEVYRICFENSDTYNKGCSFSSGNVETYQRERTDKTHYIAFVQGGGSGNRPGILKISELEPLYPSISETEYFHITGPTTGQPQKILVPRVTDIAYYQDEDEDGVADVGDDNKKIIIKPDADGMVNKRVLMESFEAGGTTVRQRKILSNNGEKESIKDLDFVKKIRVRCVRDIKTTNISK